MDMRLFDLYQSGCATDTATLPNGEVKASHQTRAFPTSGARSRRTAKHPVGLSNFSTNQTRHRGYPTSLLPDLAASVWGNTRQASGQQVSVNRWMVLPPCSVRPSELAPALTRRAAGVFCVNRPLSLMDKASTASKTGAPYCARPVWLGTWLGLHGVPAQCRFAHARGRGRCQSNMK
jgi:hypothetical protein